MKKDYDDDINDNIENTKDDVTTVLGTLLRIYLMYSFFLIDFHTYQ